MNTQLETIQTNETELNQIQTDLNQTQTTIADYQTQLEEINTQITIEETPELLEEKASIETEIGMNQILETSLANQLQETQNEINSLIFDTHSNYITTINANNLIANQEELAQLETLITDLNQSLTQTQATLNTYQTKKEEIEQSIANPNSTSANKVKVYNESQASTIPNPSTPSIEDYLQTSGMFQTAKPDSMYLIETKYASTSDLKGSWYFLNRIGYSPDQDLKIAGDPLFETKLIQKQLQAQTGQMYLQNNIGSNTKDLEALYNNSFDEYNRLSQSGINLTTGIALTEGQISNLQKDIIWLEQETMADGTTVLTPKLYLADSSKTTTSTITANNIFASTTGNITNLGEIT